jgi:hypothetical protein
MPDSLQPDAVISLHPDRYAPRAARYFVATVDRPSPDLRDVIVLLTSELVTRAVTLCEGGGDELVELRVWMPADVVRVELRGAPELVCRPSEPQHPQDDVLLIEDLSDRWSIDVEADEACIWFEIDRRPAAQQTHQAPTDGVYAFGPRL